jgi:hypothetical protein
VTETLADAVERQALETERLREDLRLGMIKTGTTILDKETEIERLRALLREAMRIDAGDFSVNVDEWMQRIREALGDE